MCLNCFKLPSAPDDDRNRSLWSPPLKATVPHPRPPSPPLSCRSFMLVLTGFFQSESRWFDSSSTYSLIQLVSPGCGAVGGSKDIVTDGWGGKANGSRAPLPAPLPLQLQGSRTEFWEMSEVPSKASSSRHQRDRGDVRAMRRENWITAKVIVKPWLTKSSSACR